MQKGPVIPNPSGETNPVSAAMRSAVAVFEQGNAIAALAAIRNVASSVESPDWKSRLELEFVRLGMEAQFLTPSKALANIATLRQLCTEVGSPHSLAVLHLSVARLEGLRGAATAVRSHLTITQRLASHVEAFELLCASYLVEATVEGYEGNLSRAHIAASKGYEAASRLKASRFHLASLANLGLLALCAGQPERSRALLDQAHKQSASHSFVRLALTDSMANVALFEGRLADAQAEIQKCQDIIATHKVPARSWYDLTHQITRCLYFSMNEDWQRIVEIVDEADPELERRHLKTWRPRCLRRAPGRKPASASTTLPTRRC